MRGNRCSHEHMEKRERLHETSKALLKFYLFIIKSHSLFTVKQIPFVSFQTKSIFTIEKAKASICQICFQQI